MQRYFTLILILFLSGCGVKNRVDKLKAKENHYLFEATYLENSHYFADAARFYLKLYEIKPDRFLLKKAIENLIRAKDYQNALTLIQEQLKKGAKDWWLYYYGAQIYLANKKILKAKDMLYKALKIKKDYRIYELLASIYLNNKEYEKALKYYKSAYALHKSDKLVNTISYIMYFYLNKKTEAIAYLETHMRIYGCNKDVCLTLASMYSMKNDIEGLISVYKKLYSTYKDERFAKKIIEFLLYERNYDEAIKYAEKIGDEELLLELYRVKKDYNKALNLAKKLYKKTKNLDYLALIAIFEYESATNKNKKLILDVAKKLEDVIKKIKDPVYLNYLGYLYIDSNIKIKRGIKLVKEALEKEPNSPYYLDSLAWGYYKVKRCKEAYEIIKRVYYELNQRDDEIKYHLKEIEKCFKERD